MIHDYSILDFLNNSAFTGLLEWSWQSEGFYRDASTGLEAAPGVAQYLLIYHVYQALLGCGDSAHQTRAEMLALRLAAAVREDGLVREPDGCINDHPANACHVTDGLGTFCHYGQRLGWDSATLGLARDAVIRIVERHPAVRRPGGTVGRSQQLRFETRAYYWAWRVTGTEEYREAFLSLWNNGIHAYQNPVADHGALLQPSLHPDFTWNYTCSSGTTFEYATNTHTPVYYNTEPQGFAFVYYHGLKEGVLERNPLWDEFCRRFFMGLLRNLSRAGHTASDVDGYGIHRAWYGGCLLETSPAEAVGLADYVGISQDMRGWFRWYIDRYKDFVERRPAFTTAGLVEVCPYGHNITIEKQFPALMGARFYAIWPARFTNISLMPLSLRNHLH